MLLANARSGIALLIELLSPAHVWIPSFFCGPIIKAVGGCKATVKFYEVDYDLNLTSLAWLDSIQQNDLVVLVDYFGFPCDPQHINKIRERGAWVLEDACQALLTEGVGRFSDFLISSPRKFLGVPDGGVLTMNREIASDAITLAKTPETWWLNAFSVVVLRREFDLHGGDRHWFELFQKSEVEGPIGPYAMSELTRMLLRYGFDYSMIAEKRVNNYELLANELGEFALYSVLPRGVVPLGFPVRIKDRDRVRQVLFRNEIYPPVHWPIQGAVPKEFSDSHRLASEIMTLPCDQRYGEDDMNRVIAVLLEVVV